MAEDRDPPIEPEDYISGVRVVDIGDLRIARGMSRRPYSSCPHKQLVYDKQERRVWCRDCETNIEAFDAFEGLVAAYSSALNAVRRREERVGEAEGFQARSIAARKLDEAWRKRRTVPGCPHCGEGLLPGDFKDGCMEIGRDYAEARARRRAEKLR